MKAFRIVNWDSLYEPPAREHRGRGPLTFVKLRVHGHHLGPGLRRLNTLAGAEAPAAFGLFCKLLELAADEPEERRDGTLYDHRGQPATVAALAFELDWRTDAIERLVAHLRDAGWIEQARFRAPKRAEERPCVTAVTTDEDEDEDEDEDRDRRHRQREKTKTKSVHASASASGVNGQVPSVSDSSDSESRAADPARALSSELAGILDVRATRQGQSDCTTLSRIARHVLESANGDQARRIEDLRLLALSKQRSTLTNKMAGFVAAVRQRWGDWPEKRS